MLRLADEPWCFFASSEKAKSSTDRFGPMTAAWTLSRAVEQQFESTQSLYDGLWISLCQGARCRCQGHVPRIAFWLGSTMMPSLRDRSFFSAFLARRSRHLLVVTYNLSAYRLLEGGAWKEAFQLAEHHLKPTPLALAVATGHYSAFARRMRKPLM
jgi:hypothetical protein